MSGYSSTPLIQKLGIKDGMRICILNDPKTYPESLGILPEHCVVKKYLNGILDFIHYFSSSSQSLEEDFPKLKEHLAPTGMLWISWPKGSSGLPTDLNENRIRDIGVRIGLVDVKVCAVDDIWSGLKFVYRVKDRS